MQNTLYIWDIKDKQKDTIHIENIIKRIKRQDEVLSLTPFTHYILEHHNIDFQTFHDLITIVNFRERVLNEYEKINLLFKDYPHLSYLSRDLMRVLTYQIFITCLFSYIDKLSKKFTIVYITDREKLDLTFENIARNKTSLLHFNPLINQVIYLNNKDTFFYKKKTLEYTFKLLLKKHYIGKLINKISKKYLKLNLINLVSEPKFQKKLFFNTFKPHLLNDIEKLKDQLILTIPNDFKPLYTDILDRMRSDITSFKLDDTQYGFFSYILDGKIFYKALLFKMNHIPTVFLQHGNYIYPHMFFKYCEIEPANINFVINDFTKKLFEIEGAKNVTTIGSSLFNQPILKKKKCFDYLYITYNANYGGNGSYVESKDCLYSFDGYQIFQRHKSIIEYFGTHLKSKKICIKMHPMIISHGLYVPVIELSKPYKNITIDFSTPMQKLIENSKILISDYFSSEFLNREIHYKRDIILFKGAPIPLPEFTLDDMEKMFILVDTIDDLKNALQNINTIIQGRKRYDEIIEYYSSKKCNTEQIISNVLQKEFDGTEPK